MFDINTIIQNISDISVIYRDLVGGGPWPPKFLDLQHKYLFQISKFCINISFAFFSYAILHHKNEIIEFDAGTSNSNYLVLVSLKDY